MSLISSALGAARTLSQDAGSSTSNAELSVRELTITVRDLQKQMTKLTNMNVALFELLKTRVAITDQELIAQIQAVEARAIAQSAALLSAAAHTADAGAVCESCGKTYSKRNNRCLYCGHVNTRTSIL